MSPGSAGTAGDGFRVPKTAGKHRAPPPPAKPPDRFIAPVAAAAVLLTAASLIAIYAPGIAPDATAAGRHDVTVSTAARSARTVHVPLTVLPVPVPSIGAEGAWDPETDAPIPVIAPVPSETFAGATGTASAPAGTPGTTRGVTRSPSSTVQTPQEALTATTTPLTTTRPPTTSAVDTATTSTTTTSPSPTTDTAAATSSATQTTEATVTPTSSAEPTPTDVIGDAIDEVLGEVGP